MLAKSELLIIYNTVLCIKYVHIGLEGRITPIDAFQYWHE